MISKFFIYRPIFASVVSIVIVILGAAAALTLPVARYPEISPPTITVSAFYPGADAETVAETVATPLAQAVNGVEGMLYMSSTSASDGSMTLTVTFEVGTDLDTANVLTQNRVSTVEPTLPEQVRRLGVTVKKKSPDILTLITLYSEDDRYDRAFLTNYANLRVVDELARVPGVSEVQIFGSEYAMRVWLDPERMRVRGLTPGDAVAAIGEQNVEVAAGKVGEAPAPAGTAFELTVSARGRLQTAADFGRVVLRTNPDGGVITVGDVGRVELGSQSYTLMSDYNGRVATAMAVYQIPGSNAIETADGIIARMGELSESFPEGLTYSIPYDFTDTIRASVRELVVTLFITIALVVGVVYVFLQDLRATLVPAVTIPVSLVGTLFVLSLMGMSINLLTLFGLVLVVGIVVDDAIVVVENTSRLIAEGMDRKAAAVKSMQEVAGPVIATTLVLLAVFVPTVFMGGITGRMFTQFAITISVATVFSSINALTMSPALCGLLLRPPKEKPTLPFRLFNGVLAGVTRGYTGTVRWTIRLAPLVAVAFGGLVYLAMYGLGALPKGFVPQEDEKWMIVVVQLPDAASVERTQAVMREVDRRAREIAGVQDVITITGYSILNGSMSTSEGVAFVMLTDWSERRTKEFSQASIQRKINVSLREVQEANAFAMLTPSLPGLGFSGGFVFNVLDQSGAGLQALQSATDEFTRVLVGQPSIAQVNTTFRSTTPRLFLDIDREQIKEMGISLNRVFEALTVYLGSLYVNDFTLSGRVYQVKVQSDTEYRATARNIESLEIRAENGEMVPLGAVLEVRETFGPTAVNHFNIYPSAKVTGQSAPGFSSGQALNTIDLAAAYNLPAGFSHAYTEISYQERQSQTGVVFLLLFSVVIVYLVLAAQYESWSLPLAVVLSVPIALLGATAGVIVRGMDFNVYTQIGIVLLIGLSAKTAILIVEFAKVRREEGATASEAALDAAKLRFRAVLMTAFSFVLGVIPLLVAQGAGAGSRQVLGTTVFSGMLLGTVVGVLTIPVLYFLVQWVVDRVGRKPAAAG